jgi:hypothetical protein
MPILVWNGARSACPEPGRTAGAPGRPTFGAAALAGVVAASFALAPANLGAQNKPAPPRTEDVLKKTLERAKWSEEQNLSGRYTFTQRGTLDELDSKENVKRHEVRVSYVSPIDGEPYARLIQKDGKPLSEKEVRVEQERERKFRQRQAERKRKKEQGEKDDAEIELNEELVGKYRFDLTGREAVNGRPAFVMSFQPRSSDLPVKRKLDRLLNKVAGRVWIDEQDYEIVRVDLHLAENVSAWGGMLASVRKFLLRVEQTKVDESAWLPSSIDAYIDGRILIKSLHLRIRQENSEFHKLAVHNGGE